MLKLYITSPLKKEGKTFITAGIAATMQSLGYKTSVYKPIQTGGIEINGFMQSPDLTFIKSIDPYINTHFSYLYASTDEPVISAELEGKYIDTEYIVKEYNRIKSSCDCVIIDGDKGLFSPVAPNALTADYVSRLKIPVLFVVTPSEDSVNTTILSINGAIQKGLHINGVIINNIDEKNGNNPVSLIRLIEEYTEVKVLGMVPHLGNKVSPEDLITGILNGVDVESVFNIKIEKLDFNL